MVTVMFVWTEGGQRAAADRVSEEAAVRKCQVVACRGPSNGTLNGIACVVALAGEIIVIRKISVFEVSSMS